MEQLQSQCMEAEAGKGDFASTLLCFGMCQNRVIKSKCAFFVGKRELCTGELQRDVGLSDLQRGRLTGRRAANRNMGPRAVEQLHSDLWWVMRDKHMCAFAWLNMKARYA